jgi:hypothetical protein
MFFMEAKMDEETRFEIDELKQRVEDLELRMSIIGKNMVEAKKVLERGKNFVPPTVEQVAEYCKSRGNQVSPKNFVDFYESKGWMIGKNKMKNWQAAVRTWEKGSSKTDLQIIREDEFTDEPRAYDIPQE